MYHKVKIIFKNRNFLKKTFFCLFGIIVYRLVYRNRGIIEYRPVYRNRGIIVYKPVYRNRGYNCI